MSARATDPADFRNSDSIRHAPEVNGRLRDLESIRTPEADTISSHLWIDEVETGIATELKVETACSPHVPDGARLLNTSGGKRDIFTSPVNGAGTPCG